MRAWLGHCRKLLWPALLHLTLLGPALASPATAASWSLFGSQEVSNDQLGAFTKWTGMLARHQASAMRPLRSGDCKPNPRFPCPGEAMDTLLSTLADKSPLTQLRELNLRINEAYYVIDPVNWGVPDYWATPDEFQRRDGDCEDYAIAKYLALRSLGFSPDDMRIVVLQDENLGVAHAILAVRLQDQTYILDNQVNQVLADRVIRHYRPIYSINEQAWWLHSGWSAAGR